eukprot:6470577-Amphidinium_carterae.4
MVDLRTSSLTAPNTIDSPQQEQVAWPQCKAGHAPHPAAFQDSYRGNSCKTLIALVVFGVGGTTTLTKLK